MLKPIEKMVARFRIEVYDLKLKRTRSKSFSENDGATVDAILEMIIHCLEKGEYKKYIKE